MSEKWHEGSVGCAVAFAIAVIAIGLSVLLSNI